MRLRPVIAFILGAALTGCAANNANDVDSRRTGSGVDRVSPVRAAEVNTRLGVGYLERGELQVAMQKLELAVDQDPKHSPAHLALGVVYQSIDRDDKALKHLRTAVRLAPDDGGAHNSYAALLCQIGRYSEADRHFRMALEDPFYATPEVALANAGSCARRDGREEDAEDYLREALEYDPQNRTALFNLARLSFDRGEPLSARAFLQRLEASGGLGARSLLLAVQVERDLGSERDAERYAAVLTQQYPDSPQASQLRQQNQKRND
ncbi:MAG: type IV pilus biogenesis/stability protein PilW [Wenzhouxiangellaceae bacterium]|nr:type IV pilus biogenesis/stability protein PilW [Wenzhouxiangellaceae bacterium]MBS3746158.1 type IV pilus biogenesis/stability protein PilW [Wenzhouxiangellaceae bacterium]MBS3822630.1 type IV pilus biogenesis/stability protein PilW [Wenzhouxiangellaceae bacterium]